MRNIPQQLVERYEANGWWTRESMGQVLARGLAAAPDVRFRVFSTVRPWEGTVAEVETIARRLAAGLRARGVGPGDVVAFQLPNWMEAAVTFWAASFVGATMVPIAHFYGRKELGYILEVARPKAFITAKEFGALRFQPDLCAQVPIVGVVGQDFDDLLADEPLSGVAEVDPNSTALIAFTSGTTRNPKGVMHSHRSLWFETRQLSEHFPPDLGPQITSAPVGHFIGMLNALLVPVLDGTEINLLDVWDPKRVLALMIEHGVTVAGGVPYYLTSLLDHPDFTDEHLALMKYAGLGGSSVPAAVTSRLTDMGLIAYRAYGSTEHPSITGSDCTDPEDKRLYTDGCPLPGVEIRLSEDGEIFSRGPDLCLGYTDEELTAEAFDDEGWYRTGDIGHLDEDGYLTITDRTADLIIRGGENISAVEIEDVLLGMPAVAEAVVVAAPDPRLIEHAAAVVRLRAGAAVPSLDDVKAHLAESGLAKQKWPEELHIVDDFPRTPSGKVQKYRVRAELGGGDIATGKN
ncbi:MAG: AMP-binding protein [Nocardia sp.]|nr:AMP-binding protein [Nocardia sp.]